jgi:hypothetical protein
MLKIEKRTKVLIGILINYAYEHQISLSDMYKIRNGLKNPVGLDKNYNCIIDDGFRVVFSIEQHPNQLMKHISISENNAHLKPDDVKIILNEFGFQNSLEDCVVYLESNAVNILELA